MVALATDFASLESILGQLPVAQYCNDFQPKMVDLYVLAHSSAIGKQVTRRFAAQYSHLGE